MSHNQWFLPFLILFLLPALVAGQPHGASPQETGMIKGSDHPELIPDREAFRSLFGYLGDRPRTTATWEDRLFYLSPSGLTADERNAVIGAANVYCSKAASTARAVAKLRNATPHKTLREVEPARIAALFEAQADVLDKAIEDLREELGQKSYQRLLDFVRAHVKPTMEISAGEGKRQ